jgi:hypothetical protein
MKELWPNFCSITVAAFTGLYIPVEMRADENKENMLRKMILKILAK